VTEIYYCISLINVAITVIAVKGPEKQKSAKMKFGPKPSQRLESGAGSSQV
jgi:hypothetical protein